MCAFSVHAQSGPVWQPHVDVEAKPGTIASGSIGLAGSATCP
jgi:hypothetical protein